MSGSIEAGKIYYERRVIIYDYSNPVSICSSGMANINCITKDYYEFYKCDSQTTG